MYKFEFDFSFQQRSWSAECRAFPIDGTTELHVTPLGDDLFEAFGVRILLLQSDGSITARLPGLGEEQDYIMALAEGLSVYFSDQQSRNP